MRNKGIFLQIAIIAIFAVSNLIGTGTSVAAGRKRPHVTRNNNVMVLEYDFEEPQVFTEGDLDFVTINGLERYNKAGEPVIPVKPVQILVPAGMEIETVTSQAIDTYQLPDTYRLSHGTKPFLKSVGPPETPTKPDPEIFSMPNSGIITLLSIHLNPEGEIQITSMGGIMCGRIPITQRTELQLKMPCRI